MARSLYVALLVYSLSLLVWARVRLGGLARSVDITSLVNISRTAVVQLFVRTDLRCIH